MKYIPYAQRKQRLNSPNMDEVSRIMENIKRIESGGNYQAKGPTVTGGQYAGEQALGAFQVMPGNIPSWSKEALGYEITPEQFLESPELQEKIVRYKTEKNLKEYGNADDVASVWFTGRPVKQAQGAKDVTGTDVNEYISRFNKNTGSRYIPYKQRV